MTGSILDKNTTDYASCEKPEQASKPTTSVFDITNSLVCTMVGAGILALPYQMQTCGLMAGFSFLFIGAAVSVWCCIVVSKGIDYTVAQGVDLITMGDIGEYFFGKAGRFICDGFVILFMVCKLAIFTLLIASNLKYLGLLSYANWCIVVTLMAIPMAFTRDVSFVSKMAFVGVLAGFLYCITISWAGFLAFGAYGEGHEGFEREYKYEPQNFLSIATGLSMSVFCYAPLDVLTTLKQSMKNPKEMPKSIYYSHIASAMIYFIPVAIAFIGWGHVMTDNVLDVFCAFPGCEGQKHPVTFDKITKEQAGAQFFPGFLLACAVVVSLTVTLPMVFYSLMDMITPMSPLLQTSNAANASFRVGLVLFASLTATSMPYFGSICGIVSSFVGSVLFVILPGMIKIKLDKVEGKGTSWIAYCVVTLGFFLLIFGVKDSVDSLIDNMSREGDELPITEIARTLGITSFFNSLVM